MLRSLLVDARLALWVANVISMNSCGLWLGKDREVRRHTLCEVSSILSPMASLAAVARLERDASESLATSAFERQDE